MKKIHVTHRTVIACIHDLDMERTKEVQTTSVITFVSFTLNREVSYWLESVFFPDIEYI